MPAYVVSSTRGKVLPSIFFMLSCTDISVYEFSDRAPFGNTGPGAAYTICTAACRSWQFLGSYTGSGPNVPLWGTFSKSKEHSKLALVRVGPVGMGHVVNDPNALFYLCVGDINYEQETQSRR